MTTAPAETLEEEGRADLLKWAGEDVNTGEEAEAYASFINGHLQGIADGADEATLTQLQDEAAAISGQRNSLFKGETLRGLLLTAYAWATVGQIAFWAAIGAFLAGFVMLVRVIVGMVHHHKVVEQTS